MDSRGKFSDARRPEFHDLAHSNTATGDDQLDLNLVALAIESQARLLKRRSEHLKVEADNLFAVASRLR